MVTDLDIVLLSKWTHLERVRGLSEETHPGAVTQHWRQVARLLRQAGIAGGQGASSCSGLGDHWKELDPEILGQGGRTTFRLLGISWRVFTLVKYPLQHYPYEALVISRFTIKFFQSPGLWVLPPPYPLSVPMAFKFVCLWPNHMCDSGHTCTMCTDLNKIKLYHMKLTLPTHNDLCYFLFCSISFL